MVDTVITLGDFEFKNMEIPGSINFGGGHKLIVHELVGGARIIDAMGADESDISWEGLMIGPDSLGRALQLDTMRVAGQPLLLNWFSLRYYVLIENFKANTERYYQIPYTINLKVLQNFNQASGVLSLLGFGDALINDFSIANSIAGQLNIPTLTSAMNSVNTALTSVSSFKNAPAATVNTVLGPLSTAQSAVKTQLDLVNARLFGG
jgi:hypothetical protein